MTLTTLDHVNIHTARLPEMTAFYSESLGLMPGDRPPLRFSGAWLYCNGQAAIHLVEVAKTPANTESRIDHFAFRGEGLADFLARLRRMKVAYRITIVPKREIKQVKLYDPDGNQIEVQFAAEEEADLSDFTG